MKFKSDRKLSTLGILREWIWPKAGWWRWGLYLWRRIWRLTDSPHTVAIGFAVGAFASFTPFLGLHFVIAFLAAWLLRGSMLAAAFGTAVGNPLTFPLIWFGTFNTGKLILHGEAGGRSVDLSSMVERVWHEIHVGATHVIGILPAPDPALDAGITNAWLEVFWPVIKPMTVGALVLGPIAGAVLYFPVRLGVEAYQARRRARFGGERRPVARARRVDEATP